MVVVPLNKKLGKDGRVCTKTVKKSSCKNDGNRTKDGIQIVLMGTIVGMKISVNELSQGPSSVTDGSQIFARGISGAGRQIMIVIAYGSRNINKPWMKKKKMSPCKIRFQIHNDTNNSCEIHPPKASLLRKKQLAICEKNILEYHPSMLDAYRRGGDHFSFVCTRSSRMRSKYCTTQTSGFLAKNQALTLSTEQALEDVLHSSVSNLKQARCS
ncbi:hypothetical protein F2Q69_00056340 [Brassica cretica]|uniref:Uncharacterized protein n=1 Tax=Brassica cretica TaxID=69181 RepID=A0A8S9MS11_BRACR|nr:hypothetical protein F2Q69_00056340 [Brassica cretica]